MAKAKCRYCGARGDTENMYKVVVGNKKPTNTYYCNESCWLEKSNEKNRRSSIRDKVYFLICDMFGYEIQNSMFFIEWVKWNKLQPDEIIYKYIRENEDYLQQVCDRKFKNETQKIMYFSAIFKNSLVDLKPCGVFVEKPVVEQPKVVVEEHYETKYKPKARLALDDLEEEYDE